MPNLSATRTITGLGNLTLLLRSIPAEVRQTILAEGVAEAAEPIVVAAKIYAARSRDTGALQASLTHVVRNYPANATALAVIGPDKQYYRHGKKVGGKNRAGANRPANYAHLVEFGHIAVKPKAGSSRRKKTAEATGIVPAKPFLRPALANSEELAIERLAIGINNGVTRALGRLRHAS